MKAIREYNFPNAVIKVYANRTCKEFPKWCQMISCERPRKYVADALRQLRRYNKQQTLSR